MKKILTATAFVITLIGFCACDKENHDTVLDLLIRHTWVADLGRESLDQVPLPLLSHISFKQGKSTRTEYAITGQEELFYYPENGGDLYNQIKFGWYFRDNTLYFIYAHTDHPGYRELRNITIKDGALTGDLYISESFYGHLTFHEK